MGNLLLKFYPLALILAVQLGCNEPISLKPVEPPIVKSKIDESVESTIETATEPAHLTSSDRSGLRYWYWKHLEIPPYTWPEGVAFGDGLYIDTAYDPEGIQIVDDKIRFFLDPNNPNTPTNAPSDFNYRSEFHTMPWDIRHPLGTEQWMAWTYIFGEDYVIDTTSPITIFQNHPSIHGLSPQIELELAALNDPSPATGGEIQVINEASSHRIVYPIKPIAGDTLEVVIHVIYGLGEDGLLQVWLNNKLYYGKRTSTVYEDYPWGGNNKWGIYHHTFNNSPTDVQNSLNIGAGKMELFMGPLSLLTRTPDHPEYGIDAYDLVRPKD